MISTIARIFINAAISIVGASVIIFLISRLAGDPISQLLPLDAPPEVAAELRRQLGLDRSLWEQYAMFVWNVLHGDFGDSYRWQMPALTLVLDRLPATIALGATAFLFSILLSIPLGVLSAVYRDSWIDRFSRVVAMLGQAMPAFWVGLMLIMVFSVWLRWLPAFGSGSFQHLILPAIALGWYPVAAQCRIVRSGMLDVLDSDYIRMARAVGTPEYLLIWKYAFRNALLPLVTIMGVYFAAMLSGAFVVETVFAWPGLGRTVVDAVFARDYPVIQAGVLVITVIFVASNMIVDASYALIDPRVRR